MTVRRQRMLRSALAISCLLHLWVLWVWRGYAPGSQFERQRAPLELRLIAPEMPSSPMDSNITPARRPGDVPPVSQKPDKVRDTPEPTRPTAVPLPSASIAGQARTPSADDMVDAAKRDVGKIDRDLRNAFPTLQPLTPPKLTGFAALEKNIEAAGVPRGRIIEEMVLADGSRVVKIRTASGTYCIFDGKPGGRPGIDPGSQPATITGNCPQ